MKVLIGIAALLAIAAANPYILLGLGYALFMLFCVVCVIAFFSDVFSGGGQTYTSRAIQHIAKGGCQCPSCRPDLWKPSR